MKLSLTVLLALALVLIAGPAAAPAMAATGVCITNPSTAVTGAPIGVVCSGLYPNTLANIYFVEPDGRTFASSEGFPLWTIPITPMADGAGNVAFTILTRSNHYATAQLGGWKVVATNPGGNSAVGSFWLNGSGVGVAGANLNITGVTTYSFLGDRNFGILVAFTASGFAPGEGVNGWFDYPSTCSGSSMGVGPAGDEDVGAAHTWIARNWATGGSSWVADASGNIGGAAYLAYDPNTCTGNYRFTVRALASGAGATAEFVWAGRAVTADGASWINVTVHGNALVPVITVAGGGFPGGTGVNCWVTRPDGRAGVFGTATTDAGGSFGLTGWADDVDYGEFGESLSHSAEPGQWSMTCATVDRGSLAITTFWLNSLPLLDP